MVRAFSFCCTNNVGKDISSIMLRKKARYSSLQRANHDLSVKGKIHVLRGKSLKKEKEEERKQYTFQDITKTVITVASFHYRLLLSPS